MEGEEQFEPVIGYLTSDTVLEAGGAFDASGATELRVDAELAVEVGADGRAARYGAALELVDVARPPHDFESIVAGNIWHRGVAFGPLRRDPPPRQLMAEVRIDGDRRESTRVRNNSLEAIETALAILPMIGERVEAGDRIICGSLLHVPVKRGHAVVVILGELAHVEVTIS